MPAVAKGSAGLCLRVAEDKIHDLRRVDLSIQRTYCALDAQAFGRCGNYPVAGTCVHSLGRGEKALPFVGP